MAKLYQCFLFGFYFVLSLDMARSQVPVAITQDTEEHIFIHDQVYYLEDKCDNYSLQEVSTQYFHDFVPNKHYYPKNYNKQSSYWYRIKVSYREDIMQERVFEFFDQTVDFIEAYIPIGEGRYKVYRSGDSLMFKNRLFAHKNFEFLLPPNKQGDHYVYFRVKAHHLVNTIIVYRSMARFVRYTLNEYFTFGLFYGMIILFSMHNLLMYMAVRRKQYIYYVLYIISVGLYEMATDGIAFQYIWPNNPWINHYAQAVFVCCVSVFALIFTKTLLHVKTKEPALNNVLNIVILLRIAFFCYCLLFNQDWFLYKFLEIIPLSVAFFTGSWMLWKKKYRPARFFVLGYFFLFLGFSVKVIYVLGHARIFPSTFGHYSIGFGFVLEMILLAFAIGDQVRLLKQKKDNAQKQLIAKMKEHERLQQSLNHELEQKVEERTKEVQEKSAELWEKSQVIAYQNTKLIEKNLLLEKQADEINRMNRLLQNDNKKLKTNIDRIIDDRVLSKAMTYDEFQQKYPDRESCYKFLADLKWSDTYACVKCRHINFCAGKTPYSRRCTKCAYEESVLQNTLFENVKIPINKAFYLVYLMHYYKGEISSYKLSEKLQIRQSTCWNYAVKVRKVMQERDKKNVKHDHLGWTRLVIAI